MLNMKDINKILAKIESYVWEKNCNLILSYTAAPLFLRQLKNNQNQTNTTGAQNFKESNNTAGWLSVLFVFFFGNELIK
jgi:hypothetical protein